MSKLSKFFKHPVLFFRDAKVKRSKLTLIPTYVIGFGPWKKYLRAYFPERNFVFIDKSISKEDFSINYLEKIKADGRSEIFVWGMKAPSYIFEFVETNKIKIKYVEDGFLRSVHLGAQHTPAKSLTLDSRAPYFDANTATDLENLLNNHDFAADSELIERARSIISILISSGISKYNNAHDISPMELYGEKIRRRILVIGQVEDDASIKYGCSKVINNNDLVRLAAAENPDADIFYKPHPDVIAKKRPQLSEPNEVAGICRIIISNVSLASCFETIDRVYTITSQAGLEASIRGIEVTTVGSPFYSGWGVTDDREITPRRKRKLTVEEIFAGAYILYAQYFDVVTGAAVQIEDVIAQLIAERALLNDSLISVEHLSKSQSTPTAVFQPAQAERFETISFPPKSAHNEPRAYVNETALTIPELSSLQKIFKRCGVALKITDYDFSVTENSLTCLFEVGLSTAFLDIHPKNICSPNLIESEISESSGSNDLLISFQCVSNEIEKYIDEINTANFVNGGYFRRAFLSRRFDDSQDRTHEELTLAMKGGVYTPSIISEVAQFVDRQVRSLSEAQLKYLLEKLWRVEGTNQVTKRVFDSAARLADNFGHEMLMCLSAHFCEAGNFAKAIELANRAKRREPAAWKWSRYLGLINLLHSEKLVDENWSELDAITFSNLSQANGTFMSLLGEAKGRYVVVGNSPTIIGSRSSDYIDAQDLVIRFNSAERDYPHSIDCGSRLDVLVMNPDYSQTRRPIDPDIKLIVLSNGDLYSTKNLSLKLHDLLPRYRIELIPSYIDRKTLKLCSASPSSGLKTLHWMYSRLGKLERSRLLGFSFSDQKDGFATSYATISPKRMPIIHDWEAERVVYDSLLGPQEVGNLTTENHD